MSGPTVKPTGFCHLHNAALCWDCRDAPREHGPVRPRDIQPDSPKYAAPEASYVPAYTVTTTVNDHVVGEFAAPIPDPFARTTVTVGWRDLLRTLITRRTLTVRVLVSADSRTVENVLALNPDHLGYPGTPSRKAWEASLREALSSVGKDRTDQAVRDV